MTKTDENRRGLILESPFQPLLLASREGMFDELILVPTVIIGCQYDEKTFAKRNGVGQVAVAQGRLVGDPEVVLENLRRVRAHGFMIPYHRVKWDRWSEIPLPKGGRNDSMTS